MAAASDPLTGAAVSALCWVPRGSAAARPRSYLLEAQERHALGNYFQQQVESGRRVAAGSLRARKKKSGRRDREETVEEGDSATAATSPQMQVDEEEWEADPSETESMDAAEEGEDDESQYLFGVVKEDGPATLNDPYLDLEEAEDSDEEEANRVLPTDLLLVAANAEADLSSLEVYVYDEDSSSFYVHHDILTGGYPLCLEWINTCPTAGARESVVEAPKRNLVASGSFDPEISLWDLDVLDRVDAVCTLGGEPQLTAGQPAAKMSKKKKKKQQHAAAAGPPVEQQGHQGPVMTLHKSPTKGHILASGSADDTVKLWDLTSAACVHTYTHHKSKVQALRWHPSEQAALLTTGYDRTAALLDVREPQNICAVNVSVVLGVSGARGSSEVAFRPCTSQVHAPRLSADAESCVWDRHHPFSFWVSTEDGCVACYDVRRLKSNSDDSSGKQQRRTPNSSSVLWRIQAHKQAASGVIDSKIPNLMVTCGVDGNGKLWKIRPEGDTCSFTPSGRDCTAGSIEGGAPVGASTKQLSTSGSHAPSLVFERELKAGPLYCCSSNEDTPQVLGFGGKCVVVWDITDTELVKNAFRLK